ncbi:hypothetical protein T07_13277 [Trichinella nelsoni]|uniref:Uncharacterized protein n=1 Tax=Trichinella nelsoni TaxID=6336 RepID=A0A0V0R9V0_9BILA|nr:hypothetical protein T07_13277 [Trichinella nelsoni]
MYHRRWNGFSIFSCVTDLIKMYAMFFDVFLL